MAGVLRLYKRTVKQVMIEMDQVHMLADTISLTRENLEAILNTGR